MADARASEKQKQLWKEEYEEAIVKGKIVLLTFARASGRNIENPP